MTGRGLPLIAAAMTRLPVIAALASLLAAPLLAQQRAAAPALPELNAEQKARLTCSAAFALAASEQARGEAAALRYPPLKVRGREYFVRFGARTMDATGASREAIKALLEGEVARLQQLALALQDPDGALDRTIRPCLPRLDAEVPPLPKPSLAQCTAIMALAAEEMLARAGFDDPKTKDLKILAAVLESRQRKALQEAGRPGEAIDRALAEAHDRMLSEAVAAGPGVEKYDLQTCYDFAKPDPDKHY